MPAGDVGIAQAFSGRALGESGTIRVSVVLLSRCDVTRGHLSLFWQDPTRSRRNQVGAGQWRRHLDVQRGNMYGISLPVFFLSRRGY